MSKIEREVIIRNPQGLHARPSAMFVQIVSKYDAHVTLRKGDEEVNGRSIMGILTLGAQHNSKVLISAEGDDAQQVIDELEVLLLKEKPE
ncbi:MAG: HPr family phosphocarrier protein [Candidatus Omnitrophica bacterium]|nr:HPr family phosphocarrier protein [Candidatus Omnitrophota bacterium]